MMRAYLILAWLGTALAVRGATPEVGKDKLRQLVKLPSISFQADWSFDPERGFVLGSGDEDIRAQAVDLRKALQRDNTDAKAWQDLAGLYAALNDNRNAAGLWARAAELYRKRVELQPNDGLLLAGFGQSLAGIGSTDEAESVLRRAVRASPGEWKCQVALGRFLDAEARQSIYDRPLSLPDPGGSPAEAAPDRPSSGEVALAQKRLDEAGECLERAVTLAPDEGEVYFRRGMHRCLRRAVLNQIRSAADGNGADAEPFDGCFSPESLADLQHASRLSPKDYRRIGGTVIFEIYSVCGEKGRMNWDGFSWNSLPDNSQRSIRDAMTRLENLAQSPETRVASGALEVLGILQGPVLHEPDQCIASLERSLALEPARDRGWEILVATLAQSGRYHELLDACEDHVKQKDTARTRVLLAKAYERLKLWDSSEEEVRTAVVQDPADFNAGLSMAALLLKRSRGDADVLAEANDWLTRAENDISRTSQTRRNRQQVIDLTLTRGIYFALADDVESARTWVKAVLALDKDNKFAQDILAAMDF